METGGEIMTRNCSTYTYFKCKKTVALPGEEEEVEIQEEKDAEMMVWE